MSKIKKVVLIAILLLASCFVVPPRAFAVYIRSGGCINTAIGCIPITSEQSLAQFVLEWALGISGGVALVLIVYSGFLIITSSGDPRRMQAGKELLTAALSGLFLIIFSAFIIRFVGQDVLNIPGF